MTASLKNDFNTFNSLFDCSSTKFCDCRECQPWFYREEEPKADLPTEDEDGYDLTYEDEEPTSYMTIRRFGEVYRVSSKV